MPIFLKQKLQKQYGKDSKVPYKVMNAKGFMKGNKETAEGKTAQMKHNRQTKSSKRVLLKP